MLKKIGYFFGLAAYVLGSIGGFGWSIYGKGYLVAAAVIVLAAMAFPTAKKWFKGLTN